MARDHARVNLDIWNDPDFRGLPMVAQHLYLTLWTHPDLTYCGVVDWRPAKLSGFAADMDKETIGSAGDCLQARHFLVIDEGREECLIRSWIRFDGLMRQPRMAISCVSAYAGTGSAKLRSVIAHEIRKIREKEPDLRCWTDERVARVLDHPASSAKDLDVPPDPFAPGLDPVCPALGPGLDLVSSKPKSGLDPVCTPATPAPAPATSYELQTPASTRVDDEFDRFWDLYPRKVAKGAARKAWAKALKSTDAESIITALKAQLPAWQQSDPKFVPHAATWLNGERWADEQSSVTPQHSWATALEVGYCGTCGGDVDIDGTGHHDGCPKRRRA